MVEVFIIGVLVSLVKIAKMATVTLGPSLYTYLAFALFTVAALSKLDKYVVWHHLQELSTRQSAVSGATLHPQMQDNSG